MTRYALVALCLLSLPAVAGESDAKADVAKKLVSIMFSQDTYDRMVDGVTSQLPVDLRDDVKKLMGTYQELSDMQLGLLVKYYTPEELKELLKFYMSPIGKKSVKIMPEIAQDVQGDVMSKLQAGMPKLIQRAKDRAAASSGPPSAPGDSKPTDAKP